VVFDEIGQLLIIYFGFVSYLRNKRWGVGGGWNTMRQCIEFKEA